VSKWGKHLRTSVECLFFKVTGVLGDGNEGGERGHTRNYSRISRYSVSFRLYVNISILKVRPISGNRDPIPTNSFSAIFNKERGQNEVLTDNGAEVRSTKFQAVLRR
jgi:hypothetical protein